ncbi:MAG: hypothetical protein K2I36_01345 [Ureaplasma sp.]|nr:hypothetical protein [Ureaplasma sp.]MDE7222040.1 hypothetical protein [Ureaplasma sp.]
MKKAIISTISSILGIAAITTTAVFLPTYVTSQGYSTYFYNFRQALIDNNDNQDELKFNEQYMSATNTNVRDLILGSKSINNGTYVLYIGSEGYENHRNFLYGTSARTENNFLSDINPALKGNFGTGLRFFVSEEYNRFKVANYGEIPVLTYLDEIESYDINAKFNYENLIIEYKKLVYEKDVEGAESLTDQQLEENKKKYDWATSAPKFNFQPGATYTDWEGKTQYFRASYKSGIKFNELVDMVKKIYPTMTDMSGNSVGVLIGFKEGKIVNLFSGSFTASTSNDGDSSSDSTTSTRSSFNQISSLANNPFLKTFALNDVSTVTSDNSFITWISQNYLN